MPIASSRPAPARAAVHWLAVVLIALGTAVAVFIAGGGEGFWLCLPGALGACVTARTRAGAALGSAVVVAAATAPSVAWMRLHAAPSPLLAVLVPGACGAIVVALRERLADAHLAGAGATGAGGVAGVARVASRTGGAGRRAAAGAAGVRFVRERLVDRPTAPGAAPDPRSLVSRLEYEVQRHARHGRPLALVALALDGADASQALGVASAIEQSLRTQDIVAQLGRGLCVLAPETGADALPALAARIARAGREVTGRVRVGGAAYPEDGTTALELLDAAERALGAGRERHGRVAA